jgi:pimeloyl-ACP methyl ester carboxylesterase
MRPENPPASLLLVHGAGSGPWVYEDWAKSFHGLQLSAVDLQADLDVGHASHADYAAQVVEAARRLPEPICLCGWSMGGLVVLEASDRTQPNSVVLIESSPPAEVQGFDPDVALEPGTFDPEEVYGRFPAGMTSRRESSLARAERKRGISVPQLPYPSLVVSGRDFPDERGTAIARVYGSDLVQFPDLDHWELVREQRVRAAVAAWLDLTGGNWQPQIA